MRNFTYGYIIYPLAVGVCLAWAITGYFYTAGSSDVGGTSERTVPVRQGGGLDFRLIEDKNIFGAETSTVRSTLDAVDFMPSGGEEVSPSAPSEITLTGILRGPYTSYAIIKYRNEGLLLKEGIENKGLTLTKVRDTEAEISGNGKLYKIVLNGTKASETQATTQTGQERRSITRREVVEKLSNVNSVMKTVMIAPYERDGMFVGYRMNRLKPDSALAKMGVENGDVIIRLNGKTLKDPAIFFDALANSENLSAIILDMERNNQKKTLYVEIK